MAGIHFEKLRDVVMPVNVEAKSLVRGDRLIDQEGEKCVFMHYSTSHHWMYVRYDDGVEFKMPVAGFQRILEEYQNESA